MNTYPIKLYLTYLILYFCYRWWVKNYLRSLPNGEKYRVSKRFLNKREKVMFIILGIQRLLVYVFLICIVVYFIWGVIW